MESLKPIETIKYLVIVLGLVVSFTNLFDCIVAVSPFFDYIMYFGVIFVGTIFLIIIPHNVYLCGLLALFGFVAIFFNPMITVSWGVVMLMFSKRIANNLAYSIFIYLSTALLVIGKMVFEEVTPSDAINSVVAYPVVYFIDYLLYAERRGNK